MEDVDNNTASIATEVLTLMLIPCNPKLKAFPMGIIPLHSYTENEGQEWINEFVLAAKQAHIHVKGFSADNTTVHRNIISTLLFTDVGTKVCLSQYVCNFDLTSTTACPDIRHLHRKLIIGVTSLKKLLVVGKYVIAGQEYVVLCSNCFE